MDLDESMDAFKKPSNFVHKRPGRVKAKVPSKRKLVKNKLETNNAKSLKQSSIMTMIEDSGSSSFAGFSDVSESASRKDEDSGLDDKLEMLAPSSLSVDNMEFVHQDVEDLDMEDSNILYPCQTCGKFLKALRLKAHSSVCLRVNFEACRVASGSIENLRCRNRVRSDSADQGACVLGEDAASYYCPACSWDLSELTEEQRNTHANRCLDHANLNSSPGKKNLKQLKLIKGVKSKNKENFRCQMCTKVLRSQSSYQKHLVACQKKKGFTTMSVLALNRPEKQDDIDIDLLAEIQRSEERDKETETVASGKIRKKKVVRKPRVKKGPQEYEEKMFRLALDISKGDDITVKKRGRKKKQNVEIVPVMSTLSPNSKNIALQARMQDMFHRPLEEDEEDIPSTPSLPPTTLKFSSLQRNQQNIRLMSGVVDTSVGGMIPETSSNYSRRRNNSQPHASDALRIPAGESSSSQPLPDVAHIDSFPISPQSSVPNIGQSHCISTTSHDDELQSPEVSSSNIKNSSATETSDSPGTSHPVEQGSDGVDTRPQRPSKWTMTTGIVPEDNHCKVKGLLSQFETRNLSHTISSVIIKQPVTSAVNLPDDPRVVDLERSRDGEIDCTLMALERLESSSSQISLPGEEYVSPQPNSPEKQMESTTEADKEPATSDRSMILENEKPCSLIEAVDNAEYSDAKLFLGQAGDILNVHKVILLCRCPRLLAEINSSLGNSLHLREFQKRYFLPFITYIYSGKVGELPSDPVKRKEAFDTIRAAAHRFNVDLPDPLVIDNLESNEELPNPISNPPSQEKQTVTENHKSDQFEPDIDEFLSQPSPTQRESFGEPPSPTLSCKGDTSCLDPESDCDIFECEEIMSKCPTESERRMSDSLSALPSDDKPVFSDADNISLSLPNFEDITGEDNTEQKCESEETVVPNESAAEDVHLKPSGTSISSSQSDFNDSSIDPNDLLQSHNSVQVKKEGFQDSHNDGGASQSSITAEQSVTPKVPSKKIPGKSSDRKRKHSHHGSRFNLRSLRFSSVKHRDRKKCYRTCCGIESPDKPTPRKQRAVSKSPRFMRKKKPTRRSSLKDINLKKVKPPKVASTSTPKKSATPTKASSSLNTSLPSDCSDIDRKPNETKTPAAKRPRCGPHTPVVQSKNEKGKITQNSIEKGNSSTQKTNPRKKSSGNVSHDEMVYFSDRLPRFKQREHIRNRPGVANMGKSGTKTVKNLKKEVQEVAPKPEKQTKEVQKDCLSKRLSFSQPIKSNEREEIKREDGEIVRKYKFKRTMHLASYASQTPQKVPTSSNRWDEQHGGNSDTEEGDLFGYVSESEVFNNIQFDDSFEDEWPKTEILEEEDVQAKSKFSFPEPSASVVTPIQSGLSRSDYVGPVPITPMPDFDDMDTPEVKKNAQKYGLKKTLAKSKMRTKLKEVYLYKHQIVSEDEDVVEDIEEEDDIGSDQCYISTSSGEEKVSGDDLSDDVVELRHWKLELSRLSASPQVQRGTDNVYSFGRLTTDQVMTLSSSVVEKMHSDHTLYEALHDAKNETGSIKRGSRQDQERCWGIVTPGCSGYNPKLNAILRFSEEYQIAITDPLVSCVVQNYIDYKKYMFDCLPVLCDRMEKELN